MVYCSSTDYIDKNRLELICIHIQEYLGFSNSLLGLNASYKCSLKDGKIMISDTKYKKKIDDFTNMYLICGMNGVGKTTILNLIKRPNNVQGVTLILKNGDNFISNREEVFFFNGNKVSCDKNSLFDFSFHSLAASPSDLDEGNLNFYRGFLLFYINNKELFSDIDSDLITHFVIDEWKTWERSGMVCDIIRRKFGINIEEFELDSLKEKDMLSFLFYFTSGDSSFEEWLYENKQKIEIIYNKEGSELVEKLIKIRKLMINGENERKLKKLISQADKLVHKRGKNQKKEKENSSIVQMAIDNVEMKRAITDNSHYEIKEFRKIYDNFTKISHSIDEILSNIYSSRGLHFSVGVFEDQYYFRPAKIYPDKSKRYLENLSHGEFISVKLRHDLFKRMLQRDCSIILDDEPDRFFHPEWSRTFILMYIKSIKMIRSFLATQENESNVNSKLFNIILTSHSPIILSDFFNEEVLFLEKKSGEISQVVELKNCFAGNISEILLDNFFVKRTIGAYSEEVITEIVTMLNSKDKLEINNNRLYIRSVISRIGDTLLKSILEDQERRIFSEMDRN